MDAEIGDLYGGDVLIEDDRIAAVGVSLEVGDAEVIDATNCIVMPGFIDSHRHTWETVIRGIAPDVSLAGYFDIVLDQLAPAYRPEDVYAGNYLGSLEALDAGVSTVLDWSHINNTPDHADEAIRGLADANLRAVYCYGNPNTSLADWWYTSTLEAPEDVRRVRDRYFSSDEGLLTLAMGTRGPGFCTPEVVKHDWELARDIGAPISVHVGMGPFAGRFAMVKQLDELGLLGPDTTYIHCNYLSDEEFKLIADTGGKVSISPAVEMMMGHGTPPTARALAHGLRPSLSIDVVTTVPGDMFTQMRFLFAQDRLQAHEAAFAAGNGIAHSRQAGRRDHHPRRRHEHLSRDRPRLHRRSPGGHSERGHGVRRGPCGQAQRAARGRGSPPRPRPRRVVARVSPRAYDDPAELGADRRPRPGHPRPLRAAASLRARQPRARSVQSQ
jgi:cytosine/adenosine deaminase-related metal-dependent hydrolase